jgi:hypothetical protein
MIAVRLLPGQLSWVCLGRAHGGAGKVRHQPEILDRRLVDVILARCSLCVSAATSSADTAVADSAIRSRRSARSKTSSVHHCFVGRRIRFECSQFTSQSLFTIHPPRLGSWNCCLSSSVSALASCCYSGRISRRGGEVHYFIIILISIVL